MRYNKTRDTSSRFSKDHRSILKMASDLTGISPADIMQGCITMNLMKSGVAAATRAESHAITKIGPLLERLRHISQNAGRMEHDPYGLRLLKNIDDAVAGAADAAGSLSKTDILEASMEENITNVVTRILVEQFLSRDKATVENLGKWAAHVRNEPPRARNGHVRLLRAIHETPQAATSRRKRVSRK